MSTVDLRILDTGSSDHLESLVVKGAPSRKIRFPATVAVLVHEKHGVILFDTGHSPRFFEQTKYFPEKLYALITPVQVTPETTAVSQLKKMGIATSDVKYIVLSHFHADHIGGVGDFPEATFVYRANAYDDLKNKNRLLQVKAGFLNGLLPEDFARRSKKIAPQDFKVMNLGMPGFDQAYDLFDDGSILILDLPGHAVGQIGLLTATSSGKVFLVADACWSVKSYEENRLPLRVAGLIFDDWNEYGRTISKLHEVHSQLPEIKIYPCHCQEVLDAESRAHPEL